MEYMHLLENGFIYVPIIVMLHLAQVEHVEDVR